MRDHLPVAIILLVGTALVVLLHCAARLLSGEYVPGVHDATGLHVVSVHRTIVGPLDSTDVPLPVAEQSLAGEQWFALTNATISVAGPTTAHQVNAAFVRGDMFDILSVRMKLGGVCSDPRGIVISHTFHTRVFAADPNIIGKLVLAKGRSMNPAPTVLRICGVAAPGFRGIRIGHPHDLWIPWDGWRDLLFPSSEPEHEVTRFFPLQLYVRTDGSTVRDAIARRIQAAGVASGAWQPSNAHVVLRRGVALESSRRGLWESRARSYMLLSGLMLLLAFGALLAQILFRSVRAARDEGTRAALGEPTRLRRTRHIGAAAKMVVPAVLAGGAAGFFAMIPLLRALETAGARWITQLFDPASEATQALLLTIGFAAVATGCTATLMFLLSSPRRGMFDQLRSPFRRQGLIVVPLACLVAGAACVAALAAASVHHNMVELNSSIVGMPMGVQFTKLEFTQEGAEARLLSRRPAGGLVRTLQEVDARIVVASSPPVGPLDSVDLITGTDKSAVFVNHVTPAYFDLLGLPVQGRAMHSDSHEAVVSERFAENLLGTRNPVGRRVRLYSPLGGELEAVVVGVVADVHRIAAREETTPVLYLPLTDVRHVKFGLAPERLAAAMHAVMSDHIQAPGVRLLPPVPLRKIVDDAFATERIEAWTLVIASVGLLAMALHGAFATVRTMMLERASETAIRRALGGTPIRIALQALGRGRRALVALLLLGAAGAAWVAWLARPEMGVPMAVGLGCGAMTLVVLFSLLGLGRVLGKGFERDLVNNLKRDG